VVSGFNGIPKCWTDPNSVSLKMEDQRKLNHTDLEVSSRGIIMNFRFFSNRNVLAFGMTDRY
jgi:hypothetical protein